MDRSRDATHSEIKYSQKKGTRKIVASGPTRDTKFEKEKGRRIILEALLNGQDRKLEANRDRELDK